MQRFLRITFRNKTLQLLKINNIICRMIMLEEKTLLDLLYKRAHHIKTRTHSWETLLCFVGYVASVLLADIRTLPFKIQIIIIIIGLLYFAIFIASLYGSHYSVDAFYQDIVRAGENHNFSLILIKDSSGNVPNKYLMKKDKRWKCYLFPYLRTLDEKDRNQESVSHFIENTLHISANSCKFIESKEADFTKASVSSNMTKTYHHTFYHIMCDVSSNPQLNKKSTIRIDGQTYKWFSIDDMKNDRRMMERNRDNITYIEKQFI